MPENLLSIAEIKEATGMAGLEQRLAALESENKTLRSWLCALEPKPALAPKRPVEMQTQVTHPVDVSPIEQPTEAEFRKLKAACMRQYPDWCKAEGFVFQRARLPNGPACRPDVEANNEEWFSQFKLAFLAISNMRRTDKPDLKRHVTAHIDAASALLARIGKKSELRLGPFLMAAFCAADVPIGGVGIEGASISIGLNEYVGKLPCPDAWKTVLSSGKLPAQYPVARPLALITAKALQAGRSVPR
jgi:hypothetical protein